MKFVNRYTIGALILLLVIGVLWLSFGGMISAWSAGVYQAIRGNNEAIVELTKAKQELVNAKKTSDDALDNYARARAGMQVLTQQISELVRKGNEANARAAKREQTAAQLQSRVDELEAQLRAQPKASTLGEAYAQLQKLGPPYSR